MEDHHNNKSNSEYLSSDTGSKLIRKIRSQIIGDFYLFKTPFGIKPLVYADYIASGRGVELIEKFISSAVLPFYANTHTITSHVGMQTGALRTEARNTIKKCINATADDVLLFVGSGATGAVNKLVSILKSSNWGRMKGLYQEDAEGNISCMECRKAFQTEGNFIKHLENHTKDHINAKIIQEEIPLVFVSIYEHHSNILPWREAGADVVFISDDEKGMLDTKQLEDELIKHSSRELKFGSFSACSNVTGVLTDVKKVTKLLKSYGVYSFFDYAAGAPYLVIDMNPSQETAIDAIFFSGHKFLGGPGTPGVLCLKRKLLGNSAPTQAGGGTVFFVTQTEHVYLANSEEKEEGGTPDIIGSIRLGLAFQLKAKIGDRFIMAMELKHFFQVNERLRVIPNLILLGNSEANRIPIFSFVIKWGERFFHYGFIAALLNDLFGIEARGGCACAGPYAIKLLGISKEKTILYKNAKLLGYEILMLGFVRFSINYFFSRNTINYIVQAIEFIAHHAI